MGLATLCAGLFFDTLSAQQIAVKMQGRGNLDSRSKFVVISSVRQGRTYFSSVESKFPLTFAPDFYVCPVFSFVGTALDQRGGEGEREREREREIERERDRETERESERE